MEKEIENYFKVMQSINDPNMQPKIYYQIKEIKLDPESKKEVSNYFKDLASKKAKIIKTKLEIYKKDWRKIEKEFFARTDKFFETKTTMGNLTAYLTFTDRCGYNIEDEYFFLTMDRDNSNAGIIHEVLHFYTHKLIQPIFDNGNIDYAKFNAFKETLTFVINYIYGDLLDGFCEKGYKIHRKVIKYLESKYKIGVKAEDLADIYINKFCTK